MLEFLSQEVLAIIGLIAVLLAALFLALLVLGVIFVYVMSQNMRIVRYLSSTVGVWISRRMVFVLGLVYSPSKKIISMLGGNPKMVDLVHVELSNMLLKKSYAMTPYSERVVIVPQCMRSLDCPASFHSVEGARCVNCGKCKIFKITKKAEELGYKGTYIAPGGGFVKRIVKKVKPKAVIGVGCPYEVYEGMDMFGEKITGQGVILLNDGCVETDIALDEIFKVMELREK